VAGRLWPLVVVFSVAAFLTLGLPHALMPEMPASAAELARIGLTAAWVAVAYGLVRAVRMRGLKEIRESPGERRSVLNLSLQVVLGALVVSTFIVVADIWRVSLTGLAVGGAVTGVVIGLAAQSTLGNAFAGAMLLSLRPMRVGEWVRLRSLAAAVDTSGRVEEINFFYTVLRDGAVRRVVPNSLVAVATIAADERQEAYAETLDLPHRVRPEDVERLIGPLGRREVLEVRPDGYSLRVEWPAGIQDRSARLERLITHLGGPQPWDPGAGQE